MGMYLGSLTTRWWESGSVVYHMLSMVTTLLDFGASSPCLVQRLEHTAALWCPQQVLSQSRNHHHQQLLLLMLQQQLPCL